MFVTQGGPLVFGSWSKKSLLNKRHCKEKISQLNSACYRKPQHQELRPSDVWPVLKGTSNHIFSRKGNSFILLLYPSQLYAKIWQQVHLKTSTVHGIQKAEHVPTASLEGIKIELQSNGKGGGMNSLFYGSVMVMVICKYEKKHYTGQHFIGTLFGCTVNLFPRMLPERKNIIWMPFQTIIMWLTR